MAIVAVSAGDWVAAGGICVCGIGDYIGSGGFCFFGRAGLSGERDCLCGDERLA